MKLGVCHYGEGNGHCYKDEVPLCENGYCEQCCGDGCGFHAHSILDQADALKKCLREKAT